MKGRECEEQELKADAEEDRKPVKLSKDGTDVLCGWRSGNDACSQVLQFIERFVWQTV